MTANVGVALREVDALRGLLAALRAGRDPTTYLAARPLHQLERSLERVRPRLVELEQRAAEARLSSSPHPTSPTPTTPSTTEGATTR